MTDLQRQQTGSESRRDKWGSMQALYAYFRGAEYPGGRVWCAWNAYKMAYRYGWPTMRGVR